MNSPCPQAGFVTLTNEQTQRNRRPRSPQAAAVASRQVCMADARKTRCVLAEVR
jgi:hypothetical protein